MASGLIRRWGFRDWVFGLKVKSRRARIELTRRVHVLNNYVEDLKIVSLGDNPNLQTLNPKP